MEGRSGTLKHLIKGLALLALSAVWQLPASMPASADDTSRPVNDNIVLSSTNPSLAIKIDESLSFLGRHPIRIRDVAAGERIVFADTDGTKVRRLFILQFEGFLPGIDGYYRYDLSASPVVAGYPFRSNGFAFNLAASLENEPGGEAADTGRFLVAQGLEAPRDWAMWRSLTVTDVARRNELILFYVEDAADHGLTLAEIYEPGTFRATPAWIRLQAEMEQRANAAFQLTTIGADGKPEESEWQSVPNRFQR